MCCKLSGAKIQEQFYMSIYSHLVTDGALVCCLCLGCIKLLVRTGIPIAGKRAVVVRRINIVGMLVALLLNKHDATVTIVHSRTKDVQSISKMQISSLLLQAKQRCMDVEKPQSLMPQFR